MIPAPRLLALAILTTLAACHSRSRPTSTFSVDVDTASYSLIRQYVERGQTPPESVVRVEEMLNYFDYAYPGPTDGAPFAVHTSVAAAPWAPERRLVRLALKAKEIPVQEAPEAHLVFLIDVSGSMSDANKLPLLQKSMRLLVDQLRPQDSVGIVVYAGNAGVVLEPTGDRDRIIAALGRLEAGGSTNGGEGIEGAYAMAERNFTRKGVNRVILATDGDFNVGVTAQKDLVALIEKKAANGVYLSVLGFGEGNYRDGQMEQIADRGNGNYAYVDSLEEGRKVLVDQMMGTLVTVAKDVKLQVEMNPARVESFKLIGYENRGLRDEDFGDDEKDAGDIGAGHTVTALYEVTPKAGAAGGELMTVSVRYKQPTGGESQLMTRNVEDRVLPMAAADADFRFAAAVAGFGMKLKGKGLGYDQLEALAKSGVGEDPRGLRAGLVALISNASRAGSRDPSR